MSSLGTGVTITIEPGQSSSKPGEQTALVSKQSYYLLKLKRKRTEDALDINEIHKNGNIIAVSACKFSSECGNGFCLGSEQRLARHFHYTIVEPFGDEILTIKGYQYTLCSEVVAEFTKGRQVLGRLKYSGTDNSYEIYNPDGQKIFTLSGPSKCSQISCPCLMLCSRKTFDIYQSEGKQIGKICDKWDDFPVESKNLFGVSFPDEYESNFFWILLGSALTLRWLYWRPFNNSLWCLTYIIIGILVFFVIIAGILLL